MKRALAVGLVGLVGTQGDPNEAVLFADGQGRHAAVWLVRGTFAAGDRLAAAPTVEAPPVVGALDQAIDDAPAGERGVPMRTAIREGVRSAGRVTVEHDGLAQYHPREWLFSELP